MNTARINEFRPSSSGMTNRESTESHLDVELNSLSLSFPLPSPTLESNESCDRRHWLTTSLRALTACSISRLAIPILAISASVTSGCRKGEQASDKNASQTGAVNNEKNYAQVLERVAIVKREVAKEDPSIGTVGSVVTDFAPKGGAGNLLIVVRTAHLTPQARTVIAPVLLPRLLLAAEQTKGLLEISHQCFQEASVSGDSLMEDEARIFNMQSGFLREAKTQLGPLISARSYQDAVSATSNLDPVIRETLKKLGESEAKRLDGDLQRYHQINRQMEQIAASQPLIAFALHVKVALTALESPILHAQSVRQLTDSSSREDFAKLSELREDAILDTIVTRRGSSSRGTTSVTLLCMGALHRFHDRVLAREGRSFEERFHLLEINPAALPDNERQLRAFLEGRDNP